jgi:predicted phosphodiesterase
MSDTHFEFMTHVAKTDFWEKLSKQVEKDQPHVAILAGDITSLGRTSMSPLEEVFDRALSLYPNVVYIPGNHEFFGTTITDGWLKIKQAGKARTRIVTLQNETVEAGPAEIYGGTLWYSDNFTGRNRYFIDYRLVRDSIPGIANEHRAFISTPSSGIGEFVVSHHFPTSESIHPNYRNEDNNHFFCANIDSTVDRWQKETGSKIKLWVHGHTHMPFDYVSVHGFRVYANPYGYAGEDSNPNFWERMLVTI